MRYLIVGLLFAMPMFAEGPEFEVASIKPSVGGLPITSGGPGTTDPTHMMVPGRSLKILIPMAFGVPNFQVVGEEGLEDQFDFALSLPAGATQDDVQIMWRNLLVSRFGLKYHMEKRELEVEELAVVPRGHKLKENKEPEPDADAPKIPLSSFQEGRLILNRPGTAQFMAGSMMIVAGRGQPIGTVIPRLISFVGHTVVDKTGLTGKYDYYLEFVPTMQFKSGVQPVGGPEAGLDLQGALQQQLGLRLVKGKGMLDVVVVDKIERTPTEN